MLLLASSLLRCKCWILVTHIGANNYVQLAQRRIITLTFLSFWMALTCTGVMQLSLTLVVITPMLFLFVLYTYCTMSLPAYAPVIYLLTFLPEHRAFPKASRHIIRETYSYLYNIVVTMTVDCSYWGTIQVNPNDPNYIHTPSAIQFSKCVSVRHCAIEATANIYH